VGPLCAAAASSASWVAERERERVLSRSLRGLFPPLLAVSLRLTDLVIPTRQLFFAFDHFMTLSLHDTSIAMLCFVRLRAASSSLVNVFLILCLRWSLLAGSGSVSDNSTFTSLFSHCPLSSSHRCCQFINSHSKHKAGTRARQSCPKKEVHRHNVIAPWSPTSKTMKRTADRSKAMVGVSRPFQGDGRLRR